MQKATATQASNFPCGQSFKDFPQPKDSIKSPDPFMTPQRKDEKIRKQAYQNRMYKTEDLKRAFPTELSLRSCFPQGGLFSGYADRQIKYTGCNCRKSQCLKMYCTCFAVGRMCDQTCLCDSCKNDHDNMDRSEAINEIIEKDPFAFSKKTDGFNLNFDDDFCNCRKSNCTKKYCDCYRRGKTCGSKCNCTDCNNCGGHSDGQKNSDSGPKKKTKPEE